MFAPPSLMPMRRGFSVVFWEKVMTFEEMVIKYCTDRGLFPDQADEVVAKCKSDDSFNSMAARWGHSVTEYPSSVGSVFMVSAKRVALEWANDNCVGAWFLPLFVNE